tara:strand:+ start:1647 stop:2183 length:537 start_codon:yes stop_codon:yes gene_type:complete
MEIISLDEVNPRDIKNKIFIYPTDTIYGIGCNALKKELVDEIRRIKRRDSKPFSVIAPSKKWIYDNLEIENKNYIKKLPGPYTFILKMKKKCVSTNVNNGMETLGVRIPKHPFVKYVDVPFVTTSVNYSGKEAIKDVSKIPFGIKKKVDFVVDGGILYTKPSTLIDLTKEVPRIIKRN